MTGVGHAQDDVLARGHRQMAARERLVHGFQRRGEHELAAARHGIARVDREVDDRLLDLSGIAEHRQGRAGQSRLDLDVRAEEPRQQARDRGDRLVEIEHARRNLA